MRTIWQCLELIPGLAAFPCIWRAGLAHNYELFKLLCLRTSNFKPVSYPCPMKTSCSYRIVTEPNGSTSGQCKTASSTCPHVQLTPEDVTPLQLSWQKLGRALCKALDLDVRLVDLNLYQTWQIGSWSIDAVPVILSIQHTPHDLLFVIAELTSRLRGKFILLKPTMDMVDAHCKELLANHGAEIFALENIVTLTPHGTLLPTKLPGELFANFQPDPKNSVSETAAAQALALVRALDGQYRFRVAPLSKVFLLYCADGLSVKEIAKRCGCARCTIFERLDLLQKALGQHPRNLRQYSAHLEKLAASLSDSRARHIHPPSAIDHPEDEE